MLLDRGQLLDEHAILQRDKLLTGHDFSLLKDGGPLFLKKKKKKKGASRRNLKKKEDFDERGELAGWQVVLH